MTPAQSFQIEGVVVRAPLMVPLMIGAMKGWRRALLLVILGALAALALPPVGFIPVLFVSLPGLVWAWAGSSRAKRAGLAGFWWGLGFYSAGIYWIAYALMTDPEKFAWMIPFATVGLGAVMASFTGLCTAAAFAVAGRLKLSVLGRVIWLAILWTVSEWLRTFVFTGFPWNPLASVWDAVPALAQGAALFGTHGLSFVTFLGFGLLAVAPMMERPRGRAAVALAAVALTVGLGGWGAWRLSHDRGEMVPGVTLRLVQPVVDQADKWRNDLREQTFVSMIKMSRAPGFENLTAVIWPETAALFPLDTDGAHRSLAALAAPPGGLLLAGAPRIRQPEPGHWQFWNSMIAVDGLGVVKGIYDKAHLVPFGEYVPLRGVLPLPRVVISAGDFSPGPGPRSLSLPGLPEVGPLICYESIFPAGVIDPAGPRPKWLLVITNDGWFGQSAGPYQHLVASKARAIEQGIPVIRSANTGISAVIDSYGHVVSELGLGQKGILDIPLPRELPSITPYARFGDKAVFLLLVLAGLAATMLGKYD